MRHSLAAGLCCAIAGFFAAPAPAQQAVFLIRHAEKDTGPDPALTAAGRARAERWAVMLADAGIDAIYTSTAQRTQETGGIIADALSLFPEALPMSDLAGLMARLRDDHTDDRVLIVGHTENIPDILSELGAFDLISMDLAVFSRLFVVFPAGGDPVILDMQMP